MPSPSPVIANMNTSVLLQALYTPIYGTFTDTVSIEFGNGTDVCGTRLFNITSVPISSAVPLSSTELQITATG